MASRSCASESLTNCVSSASSNVFWLSFNISDSRVTVLPSLRPETADGSTARLGCKTGNLRGVLALHRLA